ncbi:MAG: hypothetical protein QOD76_1236 [Solirubrobacteraceae bacterium]|jgi:hypothetical protein|nr:hypothetical protein [Solirubrobacteraceae bacterium]
MPDQVSTKSTKAAQATQGATDSVEPVAATPNASAIQARVVAAVEANYIREALR